MGFPRLVPQAEAPARVEARVAALVGSAQAVEVTQRLGLVRGRREPVPQEARLAVSLEAESPELRPPEASPAA